MAENLETENVASKPYSNFLMLYLAVATTQPRVLKMLEAQYREKKEKPHKDKNR